MPTQDDLFQAQMVQGLAQNLRAGFQEDQRQEDILGKRAFQTSEREAGQDFSAGQQTKRLESQEKQAAIRATQAETRINLNVETKNTEQQKLNFFQELKENSADNYEQNDEGLFTLTDRAINGEFSFGKARGQAKDMKKYLRSIDRLGEGGFQASKESFNKGIKTLIDDLADKGIRNVGSLQALFIDEGETKKSYMKRVVFFRDMMINREVESRMAKEDFTKEAIQGQGGFGGPAFRTATPAEEQIQRNRVRPRHLEEVTKEFGGAFSSLVSGREGDKK